MNGDDDKDEEEDESLRNVQGSEDEESPGAEESSEAEEGSDEEESSDDTDESTAGELKSILKRPTSARKDGLKVSFKPITKETDPKVTQGSNNPSSRHAGTTLGGKDWSKLDPTAQGPPEVTQDTRFEINQGHSVIVLTSGQKVFAKPKKRPTKKRP